MKKLVLSLAIIAIMGVSLTACKNETKEETKSEEVTKSEKESKSEEIAKVEYQCPMKCEGDKTYTDKDVKCPVCGMGLKEVEHKKDDSNHDH